MEFYFKVAVSIRAEEACELGGLLEPVNHGGGAKTVKDYSRAVCF